MSHIEQISAIVLAGIVSCSRTPDPMDDQVEQAVEYATMLEAKVREANFEATNYDELRSENERLQMRIDDLEER